MEVSIFLAKALGIYLLVLAVAMLFDAARFRPLMVDIINNPPLLFLSGFIALILGIALVVSHNLWVYDWRVIITLVCWSAFLKGALRVIFPQMIVDLSRKWIQNDAAYYISGIVVLILGIFLSYKGFAPFQ